MKINIKYEERKNELLKIDEQTKHVKCNLLVTYLVHLTFYYLQFLYYLYHIICYCSLHSK